MKETIRFQADHTAKQNPNLSVGSAGICTEVLVPARRSPGEKERGTGGGGRSRRREEHDPCHPISAFDSLPAIPSDPTIACRRCDPHATSLVQMMNSRTAAGELTCNFGKADVSCVLEFWTSFLFRINGSCPKAYMTASSPTSST